MSDLRALTPEEFQRAEKRLRNPATGGRIEAAKKYGVDLTLLIEQLRLAPEERARRMLAASQAAEAVRSLLRGRKA